MARVYKVFISHRWNYHDDLLKLKNLLESRGYFKVEFQESTPDTPINSDNTSYIKQRLRQRIGDSDIVLAIAGVYATYSDWVAWELQTANDLGIPIVGVVPWGQERVSSLVSDYSIENVRWNTESIVAAIRLYSKPEKRANYY